MGMSIIGNEVLKHLPFLSHNMIAYDYWYAQVNTRSTDA